MANKFPPNYKGAAYTTRIVDDTTAQKITITTERQVTLPVALFDYWIKVLPVAEFYTFLALHLKDGQTHREIEEAVNLPATTDRLLDLGLVEFRHEDKCLYLTPPARIPKANWKGSE